MSYDAAGWATYPDERDAGIGFLGDLTFGYVPDLGPVGSGAAGTYYPRDTSADAGALNFLGFYPDTYFQGHVGTTGSQRGDMDGEAGAWDPSFQAAVHDFQESAGLSVDGWIGPNTRTALAAAVAAKNGRAAPNAPPMPIPPNIIPPVTPPGVLPAPVVPGQPVAPAKPTADDKILGMTKTTAALVGLGVLAAGYAAWKLI